MIYRTGQLVREEGRQALWMILAQLVHQPPESCAGRLSFPSHTAAIEVMRWLDRPIEHTEHCGLCKRYHPIEAVRAFDPTAPLRTWQIPNPIKGQP